MDEESSVFNILRSLGTYDGSRTLLITGVCSETGKTDIRCPRDCSDSLHNGDSINGPPQIPQHDSAVMYWGWQGYLKWAPIMSRDPRLSDSYQSNGSCFSSLGLASVHMVPEHFVYEHFLYIPQNIQEVLDLVY